MYFCAKFLHPTDFPAIPLQKYSPTIGLCSAEQYLFFINFKEV
jgi:hypothetical protein